MTSRIVSTIILLVGVGCHSEDKAETFVFGGKRVTLHSEPLNSRPLDESRVFPSTLPVSERAEISKAISRIPLTNLSVSKVIWPLSNNRKRCKVICEINGSRIGLSFENRGKGVWRMISSERMTDSIVDSDRHGKELE